MLFFPFEKGSFIITISTKIPPILKIPETNDENTIIEEPFERRVMMNLLLALEACREASKKALVSNDINPGQTRHPKCPDVLSDPVVEALSLSLGSCTLRSGYPQTFSKSGANSFSLLLTSNFKLAIKTIFSTSSLGN
jgi:hypothetical protein